MFYRRLLQNDWITLLGPRTVRAAQRTVRGYGNIMRLAEIAKFLLGKVGMAFDLICSWRNFGNSQDTLDLFLIEIGYTNRLDQASFDKFLHLLPGIDVIVVRIQGFAILICGK